MFVGVAQIVGRTIFDFAIYGYIDWIEQASSLFAFLGIAYAQRLGSHIGMDLTMGWRPLRTAGRSSCSASSWRSPSSPS